MKKPVVIPAIFSIIDCISVLMFLAGLVGVFFGFTGFFAQDKSMIQWYFVFFSGFGGCVLLAVSFLGMAAAEVVGVLFRIEANTGSTNRVLSVAIKAAGE